MGIAFAETMRKTNILLILKIQLKVEKYCAILGLDVSAAETDGCASIHWVKRIRPAE